MKRRKPEYVLGNFSILVDWSGRVGMTPTHLVQCESREKEEEWKPGESCVTEAKGEVPGGSAQWR